MQASLANWGPDETACWRQGGVGLGYVQLHSLPEDLNPPHPIWHAESQQAVIAIARLDNRDELSDALGLSLAERVTYSDSALAQAAYRRWGESCPSRLLGDWALAAWDARSQRLFLARDQLGSRGLFFYHRPPFFAFASGLQGLLAHPDYPREVDEVFLYRYLVLAPDEPERTAWAGVQKLFPGGSLSVSASNIVKDSYWSLKNVSALSPRTETEYLEGFLAHFRTAVRVRLRSLRPICINLSGGLDSGAVAALAAEALLEKNQRLTAFTSIPAFPADHLVGRRMANEWDLAHTLTKRWENIEHVPLELKDASPLAAMEEALQFFPHPQHATTNLYWLIGATRAAQQRSMGIQLSGQKGNGSVSWSGGSAHILHLAISGQWASAHQELAAWRRHHACSWLAAVWAKLLVPARLQIRAAARQSSRGLIPGNRLFCQPSFLERTALPRKRISTPLLRQIDPRFQRLSIFDYAGAYAHFATQAMAAPCGVLACDPTADTRLVEYCFGLPSALDTLYGGERMVIRTAMRGLLPDGIRNNHVRGRQAADVNLRLIRHRAPMDAALARFGHSAQVCRALNLAEMEKYWEAFCHKDRWGKDSHHLLRTIMAGLFLEAPVDLRSCH